MATKHPRFYDPAEQYDRPVALIHNGTNQIHVVDTRTFVSQPVINPHPDGYYANVGEAEALCGHTAGGRMTPIDGDDRILQSRICGKCLRSLTRNGSQAGDRDG